MLLPMDYGAFKGLEDAGIKHKAIVTGGGRSSMEILALGQHLTG